jgi:hypothetical protein
MAVRPWDPEERIVILASIYIALRLLAEMLTATARVPFTIIATAVAFGVFGDPDPADLSTRLIDWLQEWAIRGEAIESASAASFPPEQDPPHEP